MSDTSLKIECPCGTKVEFEESYHAYFKEFIDTWRIDHHECLNRVDLVVQPDRTLEENVLEVRASLGELWRWKAQMAEAKIVEAHAWLENNLVGEQAVEWGNKLIHILTKPDTL